MPEHLSFQTVFEYGKEHEVANIAFISVKKLKNKPDSSLYTEWKSIFALSMQRHYRQMAARDTIVAALNEAGIRNVEVQGTVMKTLYPQPEWRMMSDIDFIIDKDNLNAAEQILKKLDYDIYSSNDCEVDAFGKGAIAVELHTDFFDKDSVFYGTISDVFESSTIVDGSYSYTPSQTVFYLYALLHCIKHYVRKGVGIRRVMDMYILSSRLGDKVDLKYIDEVLKKSGYKNDADILFEIANIWFGDLKGGRDLTQIEENIFLSNNHGTRQMEFKNEYDRADGTAKRFFKLKKIISLVFPRKEHIYNSYPFCKEHNYPIVLCWVYRGIRLLFANKKRGTIAYRLSEIKNLKTK